MGPLGTPEDTGNEACFLLLKMVSLSDKDHFDVQTGVTKRVQLSHQLIELGRYCCGVTAAMACSLQGQANRAQSTKSSVKQTRGANRSGLSGHTGDGRGKGKLLYKHDGQCMRS